MIYQLPSGKIVNISISAYLSMSDDDLKYMEETNAGTSCGNNVFNVEEDSMLDNTETDERHIEIDITTIDPNLFSIEPSSEED